MAKRSETDLISTTEATILKYTGAHVASKSLLDFLSIDEQEFDERQDNNFDERQDNNRPASTKVVDFDLPTKRTKPSASITAQNVVEAISSSVMKKDRIYAIDTACATFDHDIQSVHDEEISAGAHIALCKHLSFLLLKRQNTANANNHMCNPFSDDVDENNVMHEIKDTIKSIEMVIRCSAESLSIAYNRVGSEILPLIINEIQEHVEEQGNCELLSPSDERSEGSDFEKEMSENETVDSEDHNVSSIAHINNRIAGYPPATFDCHRTRTHILKSCTKIIAHFARVGSLTEKLAASKGLLSTLLKVASISNDTVAVPVEARLNSLWTIANLACSAENMISMTRHHDVLNTLIEVASHPNRDDEESVESIIQYIELLKIRSVALRAILNLSWANENKIIFSENTRLVELLLISAAHRSSKWIGQGKGVSGILLQSRRHAAGALRNLATAPRRIKKHLCQLKSGQFLEKIADIAKDPDPYIRDKVHATLWNLVSADTAKLFINKNGVLNVITEEAMPIGNLEKSKSSHTVAARTLRSLEKFIPEDEEGYNILKTALSSYESKESE